MPAVDQGDSTKLMIGILGTPSNGPDGPRMTWIIEKDLDSVTYRDVSWPGNLDKQQKYRKKLRSAHQAG